MKKVVFTGTGLIFGITILAAGYFLYRFNSETGKMTPVPTGPVSDFGFAVQDDFVNMFLLKDSTGYIAIDAGKDLDVVRAEFMKLKIRPEEVVAVFLTHTDMDHVAGLPLFPGAAVYLAGKEVKMLTGEEQKIPGYSNEISREDYTLLEDNQEVQIGNFQIRTILTEGHTSGSMCYLVNNRLLFTGDILSLHDGKLGPSVSFFDLDPAMTTASISRVTHLPAAEYILTSHWGVSNAYHYAVSDWKN